MKIVPSLGPASEPIREGQGPRGSDRATGTPSRAQVPEQVSSTPSSETSKAEKVASDFEALFVDLMLKSMRKTAAGESQSNAMDIYTSMLDSEYSQSIVNSRSLGIKGLILDWLNRHQHASAESVSSPAGLPQSEAAKGRVPMGEDQPNPEQLKAKLAADFYALQARMTSK